MRLSQIKLSGFKSFVDPTPIHTPGRIVGIVGPNGCGKSNIIDALRWVLGESKASALRGKSMQDVIFNGSGSRKPVARASVELVFDNSQGKAAGQWSNYAEISVKRVLQRDAESTYFINNIRVRRKDVADIFLGTGLGGNAYAIIEQGMISRIIEADPEELKTFLEEAAGISKYRDRRRETEIHLSGTKDNLVRVEDILSEIGGRIEHLEAQARIARTYRELQSHLKTTRNLLWLRKKIQAGEGRRKLLDEISRLETGIEAETASLRHIENRLIRMREDHDSATRLLQDTQGGLYQANAEVSRLQQEIDHVRHSRAGMDARIEAGKTELESLRKQNDEALENKRQWEDNLARSHLQRETLVRELEKCRAAFSEAEQGVKLARSLFEEARLALSKSEHEENIEQAHLGHTCRTVDQFRKRREQLAHSLQSLPRPDEAELLKLENNLAGVMAAVESERLALDEQSKRLEEARASRQEGASRLREHEQRMDGIRARIDALEAIQNGMDNASGLKAWLTENRFEHLPRLWSKIKIASGWENALESVLRERVNAILVDVSWQGSPPSGEAVIAQAGSAPAHVGNGLKPLRDLLSLDEQAFAGALGEWLASVYIAKDMNDALTLRSRLEAGESLVTPQGHLITRHSIHYYGPDAKLHGVLVRQQELEGLRETEAETAANLDTARQALLLLEREVAGFEAALRATHARIARLDEEKHELQLQRLKVSEMNERTVQQAGRIDAEIREIDVQLVVELERQREIEKKILLSRERTEISRQRLKDLGQDLDAVEKRSEERNHLVQEASRKSQEAAFHEKSCMVKLEELTGRLVFLSKTIEQSSGALERLEEEISTLDAKPLENALQQALIVRAAREAALLHSRKASEDMSFELKETDRMRQESDLKLIPLRERLNDIRLKEQEARISEAQFGEFLVNSGANEEELLGMLDNAPGAVFLQSEIARLNGKIESLGAVNLAAFEELEAAQERKVYLDSQYSDLSAAVDTLENAIRRIDRETRERLMMTFDEVNRNLGECFRQLFDGGQARLVLTGEQIMDSGMEIEAQPPGKKNASIRLLSGGEKALVALSLVFSLFKLNPAPFCLLDEVDAPLDESNTDRFCAMVRKMSEHTQFLFISHNRITMEMAHQLIGVTMQEQGVSRVVAVNVETVSRQSSGIMTN
ncbi:MAG: chromosome segregation protein SMC [Burkholderiales bacterium]|nr:chromosome segregation protein SMC [Burkholderiales bacterium]